MAEGEDKEEVVQWMPICNECDNPVKHYCTTCGNKLCTGCKDNHQSRRKNRDHQVVSYSAGIRAEQKSKSRCTKHPGECYQLYCKSCQIPVCTPCIAQFHSGHDFISIQEALSVVRDKAESNLEALTKKLKPRVQNDCEKVQQSEAEVLQSKSTTEQEMRSSAKVLHNMVDLLLKETLTQLTETIETTSMPIILQQKKDSDGVHRKVEKAIKEYEDNLRSSDPIDLLNYMKGRESEDLESMFPSTVMEGISLPKFQAGSKSRGVIQDHFGSLTLPKREKVTNATATQKQTASSETVNITKNKEKKPGMIEKGKGERLGLRQNERPEQMMEFTISDAHMKNTGKLRNTTSDKIWISAASRGRNIVLVDGDGKVLRTIDVKYHMLDTSGMYCTYDGELILCDKYGKAIKKLSNDFRVTTLFTTGNAEPFGVCQLQNGQLLVCMPYDRVLRMYDRAGNVVRDIGQGHLLGPYYVAVNKVNDDICVSDKTTQVVVFSISGEKRFLYNKEDLPDSMFNPFYLCCDKLGNILVTDKVNHRVHIIDRDGHFLKFLVSGKENISFPIAIDIDDKGHAWVGEFHTRNVKVYNYLS